MKKNYRFFDGNNAMRAGDYCAAIANYKAAHREMPELYKALENAITLAELKRNKEVQIRHKSNSEVLPEPYKGKDSSEEFFDVVFLIGCWEGESKRYRVYNITECLIDNGYRVKIISVNDIESIIHKSIRAQVVVLFRAAFSEKIPYSEFFKYAKLNNIETIYDVDDLIFDPQIIDQIDGYSLLSSVDKKNYISGVYSYRKLLEMCDRATVPTEFLKKSMSLIGMEAEVIPNTINKAQQIVSNNIEKKISRHFVKIGYFSGSKTHQVDFSVCSDVLLTLMQRYESLKFVLVGHLELDCKWDPYLSRVERHSFHPYLDMLYLLAECDINIAPLEIGNVFCEGKSELKFFEAGLLRIPTVASRTDTFSRAIRNGENGFVVSSKDEWYSSLEKLILDEPLRRAVGNRAYETSVKFYTTDNLCELAENVYGLRKNLVNNIRHIGNTLKIAWVIPGLIIGGGGHRNILRAAFFLSKFGHDITLYFTSTTDDADTIKKKIHEHFYPIECVVKVFDGSIDLADVVFATHWSTVSAALVARNSAKQIMYFVQDFEPSFAPMSTEYVLAENTYRLGLYHITSGPWCESILRREFNADADHFQFPIDNSIYYSMPRTKQEKNIIFFAKPEMPRRCYELGVMALRKFNKLRPDVEIIMFGSPNVISKNFDFPVTVRGVLPTLTDLAIMYSNADIGLVFSTTNPSLIPYEMMACGLPVVDLDRGDNSVNYGNVRDIALLADPEPETMAVQICNLLDNQSELTSRSQKGLDYVKSFPTEEGMARRIEHLIFNRLTKNLKAPTDTQVNLSSITCPVCNSSKLTAVKSLISTNIVKCQMCNCVAYGRELIDYNRGLQAVISYSNIN